MIPVLAALGAAHQAGLVHRDVKPENVLLSDDGRVKVVDFGLARAIEATNQTRTGVMIGTIGYMSPEQVTSGATDARSDVYAAGIMLFELLTGRQPYEGETPMSVAYRHVHDTVPAALVPAAGLSSAARHAGGPCDGPRPRGTPGGRHRAAGRGRRGAPDAAQGERPGAVRPGRPAAGPRPGGASRRRRPTTR